MKKIILALCFFIASCDTSTNIVDTKAEEMLDLGVTTSELKAIQPLDADTLVFKNERQLRSFLYYHNLSTWYPILARTFTPYQDYYTVVPSNGYYNVGVESNQHYLNEPLFAGKYYVSFKDHSHTWKLNDKMIDVYCPEGDMSFVTEWITNPYTGQVVEFQDIYNWSDRNGQNIFNENLKLWQLWEFEPEVVSFQIDAIHLASGCDYTFVDYFPGHESLELNFNFMSETYGYLKP